MDRVRELALQAAKANEHLAGEEDPQLWVMNMDMQSVECWLAMWVESPLDAWLIRVEVAEELIAAFRREGIRTHRFDLRESSRGERVGAPAPAEAS